MVQIRIYGRRKNLINKFTKLINNSTKASIAFDVVSRGFALYIFFLGGIILMAIGMEVGIQQSSSINSGLYGVTVIFLIQFSELLQWYLRQAITVESLMLSSERAFQIINLPSEKALRTDYDNQIGLREEVEAAHKDEDLHKEWP